MAKARTLVGLDVACASMERTTRSGWRTPARSASRGTPSSANPSRRTDREAALVAWCHADLDAVQIPRVEPEIEQRRDGERHRSETLGVGGQPVADARRAAVAVDDIETGGADDPAGFDHRELPAVVAPGALLGAGQKARSVLAGLTGPRHPRCEVLAVGLDQGVELVEIAAGERPQLTIVVEPDRVHRRIVADPGHRRAMGSNRARRRRLAANGLYPPYSCQRCSRPTGRVARSPMRQARAG